jgi:cellobiose-specific phosphotransferase system component IIB
MGAQDCLFGSTKPLVFMILSAHSDKASDNSASNVILIIISPLFCFQITNEIVPHGRIRVNNIRTLTFGPQDINGLTHTDNFTFLTFQLNDGVNRQGG